MEINSGKMVKSLEVFLVKKRTKCFRSEFFSFWQNLLQISPLCLERIIKKALFLCCLRSLYDNLESGKRSYCFRKKSGKSLEFWTQKSVRTL